MFHSFQFFRRYNVTIFCFWRGKNDQQRVVFNLLLPLRLVTTLTCEKMLDVDKNFFPYPMRISSLRQKSQFDALLSEDNWIKQRKKKKEIIKETIKKYHRTVRWTKFHRFSLRMLSPAELLFQTEVVVPRRTERDCQGRRWQTVKDEARSRLRACHIGRKNRQPWGSLLERRPTKSQTTGRSRCSTSHFFLPHSWIYNRREGACITHEWKSHVAPTETLFSFLLEVY